MTHQIKNARHVDGWTDVVNTVRGLCTAFFSALFFGPHGGAT